MRMRKFVVINPNPPSAEELGRSLGMSEKRIKELMQLADKLIAERRNGGSKRSTSGGPATKHAKVKTTGGKSGVSK